MVKSEKKEKALETASIELLDANNDYLMFRRFTKNEEYLALMSRVDHEVKIVLPRYYDNTPILYNLNNSSKETLNSYGGLVLKKH